MTFSNKIVSQLCLFIFRTEAGIRFIGINLNAIEQKNPFFFSIQQGQDYEVRTYAATKYMSTTVSGKEWDPCTSTGFRRLFNYIQGTNKSSEFHHRKSVNATLDFVFKKSIFFYGLVKLIRN